MKIIILAAGKGTRLQSERYELPKALREVCSKPLIAYVLEQLQFVSMEDVIVVVGYGKDKVIEFVDGFTGGKAQYAVQTVQRGTCHAVLAVEESGILSGYSGDVMVLYCDMPLITEETYKKVANAHDSGRSGCTLLSAHIDPPPAYGRIIRDPSGRIMGVVEQRNATPEQEKITEVNVGIQVSDWKLLCEYLRRVENNNPQGEYILTEVITIMAGDSLPIKAVDTDDITQTMGVNTMDELIACEEIIKIRANMNQRE